MKRKCWRNVKCQGICRIMAFSLHVTRRKTFTLQWIPILIASFLLNLQPVLLCTFHCDHIEPSGLFRGLPRTFWPRRVGESSVANSRLSSRGAGAPSSHRQAACRFCACCRKPTSGHQFPSPGLNRRPLPDLSIAGGCCKDQSGSEKTPWQKPRGRSCLTARSGGG